MASNIQEITLALSGGAARGAYHLGLLEALDELNIKVHAICGTSIGAIIGASYACGIKPREQLEIFTSREFRKIFKLRPWRGSVFEIDQDASVLHKLIPDIDLNDTNIPMFVSAVDVYSGDEIIFNKGNLRKLCLASGALFPLFSTVNYNDMLLVDGGVANHMPVAPLKGFDFPIIGVNLHPLVEVSSVNNWWQIFKRIHFLNIFSSAFASQNQFDILIAPTNIRKFGLFSLKHLETMFDLGYQETMVRFS